MQDRTPILLTAAGGAGLLAALAPLALTAQDLSAPVWALGRWLRQLSLSGFSGNLLALLLILGAAALPLLLLLLPRGRGPLRWEDGLLILCALTAAALGFCSANPSQLDGPLADAWPLGALAVLLSLLLAWLLLRLLRRMEGLSASRLASLLRGMLTAAALLLAFSACFHWMSGLVAVAASPPGAEAQAAVLDGLLPVLRDPPLWLLGLLDGLEQLPILLAAWVLPLGGRLAAALAADPFQPEALSLCEATARRCRLALQATLLLSALSNLLQLLLSRQLPQLHYSLDLPLFTLILSAALLILCRCIQRGKELQEDHDSII